MKYGLQMIALDQRMEKVIKRVGFILELEDFLPKLKLNLLYIE